MLVISVGSDLKRMAHVKVLRRSYSNRLTAAAGECPNYLCAGKGQPAGATASDFVPMVDFLWPHYGADSSYRSLHRRSPTRHERLFKGAATESSAVLRAEAGHDMVMTQSCKVSVSGPQLRFIDTYSIL